MPPKSNKKDEPEYTDEELFGDIADVDADLFADPGIPDDELFGDKPAKKLAEVRGIPAGPEPPPRGRQLREPEDPSLLRELGKSALSFAEGASFNTADEAAAVATYLGNAFGLNDDARELGDITADYNARARNLAREYPYGHAAGRVASGLALGLAGPSGIAAQAAIAGTSGAVNEYADSRDLKRTALAAGVDTALAGAGTWGANRLARGLATSSDTAKRRALEEAFGQRGAPPPRPPPTEAPLPPVPETPAPLPVEKAPAYDPLAELVNPTPRPATMQAPAPTYRAGGFDAPTDALPRPRVGGPAVLPEGPSYTPGPFPDAPLVHEPVPRVGGLPADISASERELKQIALRRARAEMPQSLAGRGLDFLGKFPGATGKTARIANAARRGVTADASEYAIEKGWLAPNDRAATGMRILDRVSAPFSKDAVEKVAYGDADTLNYALSATLHAGETGLSQADEQTLTRAVVSGDQDAINAADFRLRQRYPAYARRVERELRALNEDQ